KNEVAGGVVVVGLGVDEKPDRQRRQLFHRLQDGERVRRIGAAVDQHDAFPGNDNAAVRARIPAGGVVDAVDVNAVANFLEAAAELLSAERFGAENPDQSADQGDDLPQIGSLHKNFFLEGFDNL